MKWAEIRREFPICLENAYLMSASIGPLPIQTCDAIKEHANYLMETSAIGEFKYFEDVEVTRQSAAHLLGANKDNIGFSPNTSFSMNILAMLLKQKTKKRQVIIPRDEFPASTLPWIKQGFEIRWVNSSESRIDINSIKELIDEQTAAVIHSGVQFATGFRQDLKKLGAILEEQEIPFIVNGTQLLGAFPVDVKEIKAMALTASCHKWLCAGLGINITYMNSKFLEGTKWPLAGWGSNKDVWKLDNEQLNMRSEVSAIEIGSFSSLNITALNEAIKFYQQLDPQAAAQRILELSDELYRGLKNAGIQVISACDPIEAGIQSCNSGIISFKASNSAELVKHLASQKIYTSDRSGLVRAAVHYFNDESDLKKLMAALKATCNFS